MEDDFMAERRQKLAWKDILSCRFAESINEDRAHHYLQYLTSPGYDLLSGAHYVVRLKTHEQQRPETHEAPSFHHSLLLPVCYLSLVLLCIRLL